MTHCILLLQPHREKTSRTFSDHENIADGFFIRNYEKRLKDLNPSQRNLRYDTRDIMDYVDNLPDIGILVMDNQVKAYIPHDRDWFKNKLYSHLAKGAKK